MKQYSSAVLSGDLNPLTRIRLATFVALALVAFALVVSSTTASAQGNGKRGINGTVMRVDQTSLRVAIKSGLKTVFVDADTRIKERRDVIAIGDIEPGDRISATVTEIGNDQLLARKISVRGKSTERQVQHLTGVVIEQGEGSVVLASRNGNTVEIDVPEGEEPPAISDVVTTIVENDLATGRLKAR